MGGRALRIGDGGFGSLTIQNGATVSSDGGELGVFSTGEGVVLVDGVGSKWTTGRVDVGESGKASLTIQNGGAISSTDCAIGTEGTLVVEGTGSSMTNSLGVGIGGSLIVRAGASVASDSAFVGGSALVDGVGSTWTTRSTLDVGNGTLIVRNGAIVSSEGSFIAYDDGNTGQILVDGPGSSWNNTDQVGVGLDGVGTMNVTNGGSVSNLKAAIAQGNGSEGTVNVTGLGSTWTNSDLFVGGSEFGPGGTGLLRIANGGTVNATTVRIFSRGTVIDDSRLVSPNVIIGPGGILMGRGTVSGNIQNAEIISPGNSPGVLSINGNYGQTATGTLRIEIAGLTLPQHDLLALSGSAFLDGNLEVVLLNGFSFQRDEVIMILATGGTVNGTFATINGQPSTGTILDVRPIYDSDSVSLVLVQGSFASLAGLTPNQMAVGGMLDRISNDPDAAPLIELLDTQRLDVLPAAFDRIAPEELT